ncbi:MAG: hypothetical protein AAGA30_00665, partial [Planctomycetota bacterium]
MRKPAFRCVVFSAILVVSFLTDDYACGQAAYERYVEGLFKTYDKDQDHFLSSQEIKNMRRPPKNADTNGDLRVSKGELLAAVIHKTSRKQKNANEIENVISGMIDK